MTLIVRKSLNVSEAQNQVGGFVPDTLPSPLKHYHLMLETLPWGMRISIVFQERFRISPSPSVLAKCDRLAAATCLAHSDESLNGAMVQKEMEAALALMIEERSRPYQQFGVQNQDQLEEKQSKLAKIKCEALKKYFANGGAAAKRRIDEAILQGIVGEISSEDQNVMDRYWNDAYSVDIWGAESHIRIDQEVFELYAGKSLQAFDNFEDSLTFQNLKHFATRLKRTLFKAAEQAHQSLIMKKEKVEIKSEKARLGYKLFKGKLWAPIYIRRLLRETLETVLQETESTMPHLIRAKEEQTKALIASYLDELNSFSCCIDPQKIAKRYPGESAEKQAAILDVNRITRERIEYMIQELQSKTSATYLREAQETWGYDLQEIRRVLEEETPFQKTAARVFRCIEKFMKAHFIHKQGEYDPDLIHDFSVWEKPVEHFVHVFADHDHEVLEILQKVPMELPL